MRRIKAGLPPAHRTQDCRALLRKIYRCCGEEPALASVPVHLTRALLSAPVVPANFSDRKLTRSPTQLCTEQPASGLHFRCNPMLTVVKCKIPAASISPLTSMESTCVVKVKHVHKCWQDWGPNELSENNLQHLLSMRVSNAHNTVKIKPCHLWEEGCTLLLI